MRFHSSFRCNDHGSSAVVDAGSVSCSDRARIAERGLEFGELLERGVGAGVLVFIDLYRTRLAARYLDRDDLPGEISRGNCLAGALLRTQRKSILVGAADLKFLGHVLAGFRHGIDAVLL